MREILFRAKTIDGDWTYGYYVFAPKRTGMFGQTIGSADFDRHYILTMKYNLVKEVIPETVGQYTGLTTNGKKIFEDDIVKVTDDNGETKYCSCGIGYVLFCYGAWYVDSEVSDGLYDVTRNYYIEVIGNIHDNPELLKEGGKG